MVRRDDPVVEKLKDRYPDLHPLIFQRSLEHATTLGDLFEILESMPDKYPICWDEESHCWQRTEDITQSKRMNEES